MDKKFVLTHLKIICLIFRCKNLDVTSERIKLSPHSIIRVAVYGWYIKPFIIRNWWNIEFTMYQEIRNTGSQLCYHGYKQSLFSKLKSFNKSHTRLKKNKQQPKTCVFINGSISNSVNNVIFDDQKSKKSENFC